MTTDRLRVGIIGLEPGRSWASKAHVPALRALSDRFEIVGVANRSRESAERAAAETGLPTAFASVEELLASPEIDVVTVAVRVPHHLELVSAAIDANKHIYCEWPLGNGLAEAQTLADRARARGVHGVIGTQARFAPEIQYLKQLIAEGFVGEVLSSSIVAYGGSWGGIVPDERTGAYMLDRTQGATMLTIPVGHKLAAVREALGDLASLSSVLATRRSSAILAGTSETLPMTAPDQVLVSAVLARGAPLSIHYRGGMPRDGQGLFWEINGTKGDIRITGPLGHAQLVPLMLTAAQGDDKAFRPIEVPTRYREGFPDDPFAGNVARVYAALADDLLHGRQSPPTFDDAVSLHSILDAIETSAANGTRTVLSESAAHTVT